MRLAFSLIVALIVTVACIPAMRRYVNWSRKSRLTSTVYWLPWVTLGVYLVTFKAITGDSLVLPIIELTFFVGMAVLANRSYRPGRYKHMGPIFPSVGQTYMRRHGNLHDDNYQFQRAKVKALSDMKESLDALYYAERIANGSSARQAA